MAAYDDLETYASIFALWLEGKCYVPLHPNQLLTDTSILHKSSLFADRSHLNYKGSETFSKKIIDKIINEEDQEVSVISGRI